MNPTNTPFSVQTINRRRKEIIKGKVKGKCTRMMRQNGSVCQEERIGGRVLTEAVLGERI